MSDILLSGASGNVGGGVYEISNSIMMDSDAEGMNGTMPTSTSRRKFTFSCWYKRTEITRTYERIFTWYTDASNWFLFRFNSDRIEMLDYVSANYVTNKLSTPVFRDPSQHYHIMFTYDTTESTATNRVRVYVNNEEILDWDGNITISQNGDSAMGVATAATSYYISSGSSENISGYLSQYVLLDGTIYDPNYFGEWHPDNDKVWRPINISGLNFSGINTHFLDFKDGTSTTTLCYDVSGNDNHLSPVGTLVQSTDTPTNNSVTFNPLWKSTMPLTGGGLTSVATTQNGRHTSTVALSSGKWYFELRVDAGTNHMLGIGDVNDVITLYPGQSLYSYGYNSAGNKYNNSSYTSYGTAAQTIGDIIMCAVDFDNNKIWWGKKNVWFASGVPSTGTSPAYTIASGREYFLLSRMYNSTGTTRFNEDELSYTPPSGFNPVMIKYLNEPAILDPKQYFDPVIYTGNATASRVIPTENKVDHVVIKNRDQLDEWKVIDSVRGATEKLNWDADGSEVAQVNGVTALGATSGFTLGTGAGGYNDNNEDFIAYPFTKSAISGMDIVLYTGNGSNRTIAHSLGVVPQVVIVKSRDEAGNWYMYHESVGATKTLYMDRNLAPNTSASHWNNTAPTSSVFTVGTNAEQNSNGDLYVAYVFASVEGFSKFGGYKGNGSTNGTFVYTGFKPAFIIFKRYNTTGEWILMDTTRWTYNSIEGHLHPDLTNAENTTWYEWDSLSNGFKLRNTDAISNNSGNSFMYMAFAEYPFALLNNSEL